MAEEKENAPQKKKKQIEIDLIRREQEKEFEKAKREQEKKIEENKKEIGLLKKEFVR